MAGLRDEIHADVCANGFDADRNTFTQSYGSPALDAALLLIPRNRVPARPDPRKADTVRKVQRALSRLLDLDLVVIGGGLAEKLGQDLADRIAAAARPWMLQPGPGLRFVTAELGDDSGVVGAASLARAAIIAG